MKEIENGHPRNCSRLQGEVARIDRVIDVLDELRDKDVPDEPTAGKRKGSGHALTPEGRRRLSLAMKRRGVV